MQLAMVDEANEKQHLSFKVVDEEYAIGILKVREILRYEAITKVPSTPSYIAGVINLRGSVVPVVNLAVKFGLEKTPITKWTCIVIVETELNGEETIMGIMADSVSQVLDLSADDIEPPPAFGSQVRVEYILGMGKLGEKFVLILDIDKVLSTDEILQATEVARSIAEDIEKEKSKKADGANKKARAKGGSEKDGTEKTGKSDDAKDAGDKKTKKDEPVVEASKSDAEPNKAVDKPKPADDSTKVAGDDSPDKTK